MDNVSQGYVMGYDHHHFPPDDVPSSLGANMSQDSHLSDGDVKKLSDNSHEEKVVGSWLNKDGTSKQSKGGGNGGVNWLPGEDGPGASGETVTSEEEDKATTEDEDKYSTDEDMLSIAAKYSGDEEDSKYSAGDEAKYCLEDGIKYPASNKKRLTVIEEQKAIAENLDEEWLQNAGSLDCHLTQQKEKQIWDSSNDEGISPDEQWHSCSDGTSSAESEEEMEKVEKERKMDMNHKTPEPNTKAAVSSNYSKPVYAKPILSFDEYGNLTTTYHSPEINSGESETPVLENLPEKINVPLVSNEQARIKKMSNSKENLPENLYNGELKSTKHRSTKVVCDGVDHAAVTEQVLKQAFKEDFNTAATSRYGRARKRKIEDGFFFGTINFNELRKITSGSPKKGKGSNSKNSSPEQKGKQSQSSESGTDNFDEAVERFESHNATGPSQEETSFNRVQMWDTKDSDILVQNEVAKKDVGGTTEQLDSIYHQAEASKEIGAPSRTSEKDLSESEAVAPSLSTGSVTCKRNTAASEGTESEDKEPIRKSPKKYRKRKKSIASRGQVSKHEGNAAESSTYPVTSDRLLRGRSDVDKIKQALRQVDAVAPSSKRTTRAKHNLEPAMSKPGVPATQAQESQVEVNVKMEPLDDVKVEPKEEIKIELEEIKTEPQDHAVSQDPTVKPNDTESTTKFGRVVRKPQLMDISDEAKKQKLIREQQKLSGALLNSSLDEMVGVSGVNLGCMEKEHPCEYMVGDLVWVHMRGNPLWPAMISYDPLQGEYTKVTLTQTWYKIRGMRLYHVQFFNDDGMTYWITPSNVVPFEGSEKLHEYLNTLKEQMKDMKKHKRAHIAQLVRTLPYFSKSSSSKYERWIAAIDQAKTAMAMDRYERIQHYALRDVESKEEDTGVKLSSQRRKSGKSKSKNIPQGVNPEARKRGRPRKLSLDSELSESKSVKSNGESTDGEFSGFDENSSEDQKKRLSLVTKMSKEGDFAVYLQKHLENFMVQNPELSEYAAKSRLRWRWKKLSNASSWRYKSKQSQSNLLKRKHESEEGEDWDDCEPAKRARTDDDLEEGRGVYRVVSREKVCCRCEGVSINAGTDMIRCKGVCCGIFHLACLGLSAPPKKDFKCDDCQTGQHPCFNCKSAEGPKQKCSVTHCGKFYHEECTKHWPQMFKQRQQEKLVCPRHVCHMCAANADDIGDPVARNAPFTRCLRCPTTYHTGEDCLAAGTEEVSQNHHICTKHLQLPKNMSHHVNVNWCFCCSKGGSLLLCDQCPAAFHADCLEITAPDGGYVCEDCQNGKFPVYGDIVWVKLGLYRWWPGQVLHPRFIPDNIENLPHQQGMFCVHFFGSNDYYWVTRGRTFLYQEGDKGSRAQSSKTIEMQFSRALDEALEAYRAHKRRVTLRERRWSQKGNLKPPPYVRIDSNRPVGNVRLSKLDLASVNRCDCDPNSEAPCGSDEVCLNRMLMFECVREVCGAGEHCGNQRFQKRQYPNIGSFRTGNRGWGLKTHQDITKGEFVIEYVGELIDDDEFQRRIVEMHHVKEENFYFLTIDKDIMIDAGPKGNLARFMNHSCQPNCETQKWTVGGDTRVGLFASQDIPAGSEITFNYNLECVGTEKKQCWCGAPQCSGFIGAKVQKNDVAAPKKDKLSKQKKKRRRREVKVSEDECFRCGTEGDLILCDATSCPKGYHLDCLGLDTLPKGKWSCPWHYCDECGSYSSRANCCEFCPNSYCRQHLADNLQVLPGIGTVCIDHNTQHMETLRGQTEVTAVTDDQSHSKKEPSQINQKINGLISDQPSPDIQKDVGRGTRRETRHSTSGKRVNNSSKKTTHHRKSLNHIPSRTNKDTPVSNNTTTDDNTNTDDTTSSVTNTDDTASNTTSIDDAVSTTTYTDDTASNATTTDDTVSNTSEAVSCSSSVTASDTNSAINPSNVAAESNEGDSSSSSLPEGASNIVQAEAARKAKKVNKRKRILSATPKGMSRRRAKENDQAKHVNEA